MTNSTTRSAQPRSLDVEVAPGISRAKALFLFAAGISYLLSIGLFFSGDRERGLYVGLWVPSILACGTLLLTQRRKYE